jgi:hypothetical protein
MRAGQIIAVALVAGALLAAAGAHTWLSSSDAGSAASAPVAPTSDAVVLTPPTVTPPPQAAESPAPTVAPSADPVTPGAQSLDARMAEASSEAAHRTQRYLHSRRDDGQHAE